MNYKFQKFRFHFLHSKDQRHEISEKLSEFFQMILQNIKEVDFGVLTQIQKLTIIIEKVAPFNNLPGIAHSFFEDKIYKEVKQRKIAFQKKVQMNLRARKKRKTRKWKNRHKNKHVPFYHPHSEFFKD